MATCVKRHKVTGEGVHIWQWRRSVPYNGRIVRPKFTRVYVGDNSRGKRCSLDNLEEIDGRRLASDRQRQRVVLRRCRGVWLEGGSANAPASVTKKGDA